MKVNIYYGGRGLIEDPTLYVIQKITEVLKEIRVEVTKYNLYEEKNNINTLPKTLKEADGVILAVAVEWMGIGGYMQQFLDACWLYGDKQKIGSIYMLPVIMATTFGEHAAEQTLIQAWEILGGIATNGLTAYVENHIEFETNPEFANIIEKKAENLYRIISQKQKVMPSSTNAMKHNIMNNSSIELTPQESEQLSLYVSDDSYVKKQKEDIEELSSIFREMLEDRPIETENYTSKFKDNFKPTDDFSAVIAIQISDLSKTLFLEINGKTLNCSYVSKKEADITATTTKTILDKLVSGQTTFQKAFMSGELTAKGNFGTLRMLDNIFKFHS